MDFKGLQRYLQSKVPRLLLNDVISVMNILFADLFFLSFNFSLNTKSVPKLLDL